jgi:3-oxoacyl-[acyl-carrier-protein] synthase II
MKQKRRVVITGIGIIAPNGIGKKNFYRALKDGVSGIKNISYFDTSKFSSKVAGEIHNFDLSEYVNKNRLRRMDKSTAFAIAASKMAFSDSNLKLQTENQKERTGVTMGTSIGGQGWLYSQHKIYAKGNYKKLSPFSSVAIYPNACSTEVSLELKLKGPSETISCGCASTTGGLGNAMRLIKSNIVDTMLVGGTEAPLLAPVWAGLCASRNLSTSNKNPTKASRPFDKDHNGIVISEGAASFVLEELEQAKKRKAYIYGEITGWASTCDAYHSLKPEPSSEQEARAILMALKDASLSSNQIDYICANGLSIPLTDIAETKAIKKALGQKAYKIPISSIKSMTGQPFAASGAMQIIASLLALEHNFIPPTINLETPAPECDLDYTPNISRQVNLQNVLINTFAFGGKNIAVTLSKL